MAAPCGDKENPAGKAVRRFVQRFRPLAGIKKIRRHYAKVQGRGLFPSPRGDKENHTDDAYRDGRAGFRPLAGIKKIRGEK